MTHPLGHALSGAVLGPMVGWLLWSPLVYRAIRRACELDGTPAPRHLPGWSVLAIACALAGAGVNVACASYFAAIPAAAFVASAQALIIVAPARYRAWRRRREELRRLRSELSS